jgi:hypothetical protein
MLVLKELAGVLLGRRGEECAGYREGFFEAGLCGRGCWFGELGGGMGWGCRGQS